MNHKQLLQDSQSQLCSRWKYLSRSPVHRTLAIDILFFWMRLDKRGLIPAEKQSRLHTHTTTTCRHALNHTLLYMNSIRNVVTDFINELINQVFFFPTYFNAIRLSMAAGRIIISWPNAGLMRLGLNAASIFGYSL